MGFTFLTDSFAVSAQILPEVIGELPGQGFVAVVCNRPDGEDEGQPLAKDIEAACVAAGLEFMHLPMVGPNFTADDVAGLQSMMEKGKVLSYCRSGNRSAILWKAAHQ